jgi:hypothetical protein
MRKVLVGIVSGVMLTLALPTLTAQADTLRVPKNPWPLCSTLRPTYCVASVTIQPIGTPNAVPLTWYASGSPVAAVTPSASPTTSATATPSPSPSTSGTATPSPSPSAAPSASAAPAVQKATAGVAKPGMWSVAGWADLGLAYDGIYVVAKTANEFTNHVMIDVQPIVQGGDNATHLAAQSGGVYSAPLDQDTTISITLRTGDIKTGVTVGVGQNVTVVAGTDANGTTYTITGEPVRVPLAAKTADCTGETGRAIAVTNQLQAIIVVQNDTAGFGVEGTSGDMYVASNGVCQLSTPVWHNDTKEMTWQVAAPHFAEDGTTVNLGFYKAVIPVADAKLLWGLDNANDAATALEVSVTTSATGSFAALKNISVKNGRIIIDATAFTYSSPKLTIKKNPNYKPSKASAAKLVKNVTCVKGKSVKAYKGKCPKGWSRKK